MTEKLFSTGTKSIKFLFLFFLMTVVATASSVKGEGENPSQVKVKVNTSFHLKLMDRELKAMPNKTVVLSKLVTIDSDGGIEVDGEIKAQTNENGVVIFNLEENDYYAAGQKYIVFVDDNTARCFDVPAKNQIFSTSFFYGFTATDDCK